MYVLILTSGYPSEKYKGLGIFEFDQAKALKKIGCKIVYGAIDLRSIRRLRKLGFEKKNIEGIEVYSINIPLGRVFSYVFDSVGILALRALYKIILADKGKPDVLHAHFTDIGYIASKLKKNIDIPLVITEHSSLINRDYIEKKLYKKAAISYNAAESVISVSPTLSKRIEDMFHVSSIHIPNMVDTSLFMYYKKANNDQYRFVTVANLVHGKRIDLLIHAFYQAFGNHCDIILTIYGEGSERHSLEGLIKKYGLLENIKLKGMETRSALVEEFKRSDCFVLASESETFGVAYIEALAMGLPVIATRCGGPESFVNESNGLLIDVNDKNQLADALIYMLNNSQHFDRKGISEATRKKISPESVANQIIKVYQEILY